MSNYGFEVGLNGKTLTRAGLNDTYFVLTCILDSFRRKIDESEELYLSVGGLKPETEQYVDWVKRNLKLGDVVSIQVINDDFDQPVSVKEKEPREVELKRKIEYFHQLKEELKGYLDE
ncbi:MAG: hypothetical protein LBQ60_17460 [Bacteroidales bacterium]|jgi:hypothetical protein|nr:hypothetical protein [Bacteroidales bacterium]